MESMYYELLIRAVFQTLRTHKNGADADIYRGMEHAHRELTAKTKIGSQDDREYEYRKAFAAVRMNVEQALKKGMDSIKYSASPEELETLNEMISSFTFEFYDKEKIDQIIIRAIAIFRNHGLEV